MAEAPDRLPRTIGRYTVVRELRRGRRSVSYSAQDPLMNRALVIKAVALPPAGSPERLRREQAFVRQAQAAARLQHPNIVMVMDAGLEPACGFLAIERVNGRPLHELLAGGLRPEFSQCASIGARIADAVAFAHANGVAHGRLGPQHVYLQPDGAPKVSGFAGWTEEDLATREAGQDAGHASAPPKREVSEEARMRDIRAIGQLMYMMLTGRAPPPAAETAGEAASPTREARPETPPALAQLIDRALRMEGDDSPRSAAALRNSLTAFIWNERSAHVSPHLLGQPLAPPERAPVHVATIPLQEGLAPLPEPAPAPAEAPAGAQAAQAPAPAHPSPPAAPAPARTHPTAPPAAGPWHALLLQRLRPWAIRYRIALFCAGAFVFVGVFLGVILGNLRPAAPESAPAASAVAQASEAQLAETRAAEAPKSPVSLDVRPWGEIFIDSKPTGVSPPLMQLELSNGRHHIEIRRDPSPAWSTDIDVEGTAPLRIEHAFE